MIDEYDDDDDDDDFVYSQPIFIIFGTYIL